MRDGVTAQINSDHLVMSPTCFSVQVRDAELGIDRRFYPHHPSAQTVGTYTRIGRLAPVVRKNHLCTPLDFSLYDPDPGNTS